jgi:tetratricopeptide (TPR) repeat protein
MTTSKLTWRAVTRAIELCALAALVPGATAEGQRKKPVREFTRQGILVTTFAPVDGADIRLARRAADVVRSRIGKLADRRDLDVISAEPIQLALEQGGFRADTTLDPFLVAALARQLRGDEYVIGAVGRTASGIRLTGRLVLVRDKRLGQPLPPAIAPTLEAAADQFARFVIAARTQLDDQRRCENALRELRGAQAVQSARSGIAEYPGATIARTCLVWALRLTWAPATEVLSSARELLELDEGNAHGLEAAAVALDSLRRPNEAAEMWLRLAETDTADKALTERVLIALFDGGNARRAEPLALRAWAAHPEHLPFVRQVWRITVRNRSWPHAIRAGETLLADDSVARADPTFFLRLATAYKSNGQPFKAIELAARAVTAFPGEGRLYALYTQFVKAEADTAIGRGLTLFPQNAELLALNAKELRARGKLAESLEASRLAVAADSTLPQGELMVAQTEMELGRPDSALASLRRALARGEDTAAVAQFALGKGNTLYRGANGTQSAADFKLAARFLAFADSLRSLPTSRFLLGAAALGVVQTTLTEAPKLGDKVRGCEFARSASEMLPVAKAGLEAGREIAAEAAQQSLEYLQQLEPYAKRQIEAFCDAGSAQTSGPGESRY